MTTPEDDERKPTPAEIQRGFHRAIEEFRLNLGVVLGERADDLCRDLLPKLVSSNGPDENPDYYEVVVILRPVGFEDIAISTTASRQEAVAMIEEALAKFQRSSL